MSSEPTPPRSCCNFTLPTLFHFHRYTPHTPTITAFLCSRQTSYCPWRSLLQSIIHPPPLPPLPPPPTSSSSSLQSILFCCRCSLREVWGCFRRAEDADANSSQQHKATLARFVFKHGRTMSSRMETNTSGMLIAHTRFISKK